MNTKCLTCRSIYTRILVFMALLSMTLGVLPAPAVMAQSDLTVSTADTVLNRYTEVTGVSGNTITVSDIDELADGASHYENENLSPGDWILIHQAQGASFTDTSNSASYGEFSYEGAGEYELARVDSIVGNVITVDASGAPPWSCGGIQNTYNTITGSVQVVRVPRYDNLTITSSGSVVARDWDGTTGGIVALLVDNELTIDGSIDATDRGFRGGEDINEADFHNGTITYRTTDSELGADKGESILGYQDSYNTYGEGRFGRGAPANGGGGGDDTNSGGAGGGNAGAGGRGGNAWDGGRAVGGEPGRQMSNDPDTRLFFGGGGGAGEENNDKGTAGGDGGGLVILGAAIIRGSGSIMANGGDAADAGNDGAGGGGAGGSIVIQAGSVTGANLKAEGGDGGDMNNYSNHGPGGGGGGGYTVVDATIGSLLASVSGGNNGTIATGGDYGAADGNAGSSSTAAFTFPGCSSPVQTAVDVTLDKSVMPDASVESGSTVTYTIRLENSNAISDTNAHFTDTLPSQVDFGDWVEKPTGAVESSDEITWTGTLTGNTTITFAFTANHTGDYCDVVENTAEYSSTQVQVYDSDTFVIECPDLKIGKSVTPAREINPGGRVTYTLAFSNTGPIDATNVVITDRVPVSMTNASLGWSGSCDSASIDGPTDTYVWSVSNMPSSEKCTITITGDISGTLVGPHTFANEATIETKDFAEYNTANNSNSADVTVNTEPVANAGSPQNTGVGDTATLYGNGTDQDGHTPLAYGWEGVACDPAPCSVPPLSDSTAKEPTLTTDIVWTGILTYSLTVTDSLGLPDSTPDLVTVTVKNVEVDGLMVINDSPTLLGRTTEFTATITDGSSVTYTWDFGDGAIGYSDDSGHVSNIDHDYSFCAPVTEFYYTAVVTAQNSFDGSIYTDVASTPVTITNLAPFANIAEHRQAVVGSLVTLDGSNSYDQNSPWNDIVEYGWTQAGIITVTLSDKNAAMPNFTVPEPPTMPTVLTFTLTVTDTGCLTDSDFITLTIVPPVGGHTAPIETVEALQPWIILVAMFGATIVLFVTLKRRIPIDRC